MHDWMEVINDKKKTILLFGATGWIGKKVKEIMISEGYDVIDAKSRLNLFNDVSNELESTDFDYCFLCAGITRNPNDPSSNIDWCEWNQVETLKINYFSCWNLFQQLTRLNKKMIYFGTGCIYQYNEEHPSVSDEWNGYTEEDEPNFSGSVYSSSKIMFEDAVRNSNNALILRLRMPIDSHIKKSPRNFISKIIKYERVVNVPNSMSVLDDLLPLVPKMLHLHGVYNFVNPGVISHNEILDKYIEYVNPEFKYKNFTLEEQEKVILAPRSNCALNANKLLELFPEIPNIHDSIVEVMKRIKMNEY